MKMWVAQIVVDLIRWVWIYFAFVVGNPLAIISFLCFTIVFLVISLFVFMKLIIVKEPIKLEAVLNGRSNWETITTIVEIAVIVLLGYSNIATIYFMGFLIYYASRNIGALYEIKK